MTESTTTAARWVVRPSGHLDRVCDWLRIPVVDRRSTEAVVDAVRILVGLVLVVRLGFVFDASRFMYADAPDQAWFDVPEARRSLVQVALSVWLLSGFLAPLSVAALALTSLSFDVQLRTGTLGTQVLVILLATMFALGPGRRWSVDSLIVRRAPRSPLGRIVRMVRNAIGSSTPRLDRWYVVAALVAYWTLSLGGIAYHLVDDYWSSGDTVRVALTSSYLSTVWGPARWFDQNLPIVLGAFSILTGIGQTAFQLLLLPLLRWTWGRRFVIAWGLGFFSVSALFLQLSYLPWIELLLWALIFLPVVGRWPEAAAQSDVTERSRRHTISVLCCLLVALASLAAVVTAQPVMSATDRVTGWTIRDSFPDMTARTQTYVRSVGLAPPNVFNRADLRMGDRWPMIHRRHEGSRELVPLSGAEGERLDYHRSDVVYFGNALRWRRFMIGRDVSEGISPGSRGRSLLQAMVDYDAARTGAAVGSEYCVEIWESNASDLSRSAEERYQPSLVGSVVLTAFITSESMDECPPV